MTYATTINPMSAIKYFENLNLYKATRLKDSDFRLYTAPVGTKVINTKTGVTYYVTEQKPFILESIKNVFTVIDAREVTSKYCFYDGTAVTFEALKSRMNKLQKQNGGISIKLQRPMLTREFIAVHVPKAVRFQIGSVEVNNFATRSASRKYGGGDFLVCPVVNNHADLRHVKVVPADVFEYEYNIKAFDPAVVERADKEVIRHLSSSVGGRYSL